MIKERCADTVPPFPPFFCRYFAENTTLSSPYFTEAARFLSLSPRATRCYEVWREKYNTRRTSIHPTVSGVVTCVLICVCVYKQSAYAHPSPTRATGLYILARGGKAL